MEVGIVASTDYRDDGVLTASPTVFGPGASSAADHLRHPLGIQSRPRSPKVDATTGEVHAGAAVLYFYEGSQLHQIALDDERRIPKLPALQEGDTLLYADADGLTIKLSASDGAILIDSPSGGAVKLRVSGGPSVEIANGKVKVGDASAESLAVGKAFAALWTMLGANGASIDAAVLAATGSAPPQPFAAFFSLHSAEKLQTTIVEGT